MRLQNVWRSTIYNRACMVWAVRLSSLGRHNIKAGLRPPEFWISTLLNLNWTAKPKHPLFLVHPSLHYIRQIQNTKAPAFIMSSDAVNPSNNEDDKKVGHTPPIHLSYLLLKLRRDLCPVLTTTHKLQLPRKTGRSGFSTTIYTIISTT